MIIIPILILVSLPVAYYYKKDQGKTENNKQPIINVTEDEKQGNSELTISNASVQEADYKQVFGDIKIQTIRAQLSDGRPWGELAISDAGEIYGFVPINNNMPCQLITFNINTQKTDVIYTIKDKLQPVMFKYNDDYFAWTESLSQYEDRQSRIVLFNRKTKESFIIDEQKKVSQDIPPQSITLGYDYVLWSNAKLENGAIKYTIMKYDIESKKNSIFKENATSPSVGDNAIVWLGPENEKKENSAIYLNNLKDNSIRKVTEGKDPFYLQSCGNSLVFSGADNLDYKSENKEKAIPLYSVNLYEDGKIEPIQKSGTDRFDFPAISKNFISWRATDKVRVYDRKTKKIAILPSDHPGYGETLISNNYILWHVPAIKDDHDAKVKAIQQGIYLSDLQILFINR